MKITISLLITFILFSSVLQATKPTWPKTREQEINEAYHKIATGYLILEESDRAHYHAGKITDPSLKDDFYFFEFNRFFENGELRKAINCISNLTFVDSTRKVNILIANNNRDKAILKVVEEYLATGMHEMAIDLAVEYDCECALQEILNFIIENYLQVKDFDNSIKYAEMISLTLYREQLLSMICSELTSEHHWDRGLDLCKSINTPAIREKTYFSIASMLIRAGFLDRLPEFIDLIKNESKQDRLILSAIGYSVQCHFYKILPNYINDIKSEDHKREAYVRIFLGLLDNNDLDYAINFLNENNEIDIALEVAAIKKNEIESDQVYTALVQHYLDNDNHDQALHIIDNLISDIHLKDTLMININEKKIGTGEIK